MSISTVLQKLNKGAKVEMQNYDSEDLAMEHAFVMLVKDIHYYDKKLTEKNNMSEGRYDTVSNQISSDIFNHWKDNFKPEGGQIEYEESYDNSDVAFDVNATLVIEPGYGAVTMDGGADYSPEGEYDDFIQVTFKVDPEMIPTIWETISMNLKDVIRHEIEHLTHSESDNMKQGKYIGDDIDLRALIDMEKI